MMETHIKTRKEEKYETGDHGRRCENAN